MNKLRWFLIKVLAGKAVIILNATIDGNDGIHIKVSDQAYISNTTLTNFGTGLNNKRLNIGKP